MTLPLLASRERSACFTIATKRFHPVNTGEAEKENTEGKTSAVDTWQV
jgi:hypothetical protein